MLYCLLLNILILLSTSFEIRVINGKNLFSKFTGECLALVGGHGEKFLSKDQIGQLKAPIETLRNLKRRGIKDLILVLMNHCSKRENENLSKPWHRSDNNKHNKQHTHHATLPEHRSIEMIITAKMKKNKMMMAIHSLTLQKITSFSSPFILHTTLV